MWERGRWGTRLNVLVCGGANSNFGCRAKNFEFQTRAEI